jgi:hypothetical protein
MVLQFAFLTLLMSANEEFFKSHFFLSRLCLHYSSIKERRTLRVFLGALSPGLVLESSVYTANYFSTSN